MHLTRMRFGGVPPFTKPVEFKFDKQVNLFVGPNASGKSRVLSSIDDRLNESADNRQRPMTPEQRDLQLTFGEESDYFDDWTKGKNLLCADPDFANAYFHLSVNPSPPVVYIGPVRVGLPSITDLDQSDSYGSTAEEALSGPFCGARLKTAIDFLYAKTRRMYEEESQEDPQTVERRAGNFLRVDEVAHSCARSICAELLTSYRARNYPTGLDVDYITNQPMANLEGISINRLLAVATVDTPQFDHISPGERPVDLAGTGFEAIYVGDLSSGSQSTLLWVWWLALKMLNHYEFVNDWHKLPAILLIDEIENHLHPTWQRRVIPALLNYFPGLQIFATTHSPFVVAGLRAGQVHMLARDWDGVVAATTNERDIIGWTTDEILRAFMGVDEPTDQLTVDRTNRLRELRGKETLSDAEAVELAELRRNVNEDFIASSTPLEAQRERYGDMMLDFLRSRQSELSQENG